MRRQVGRVDDEVGVPAQGLHHEALLADAFDDAIGGRERVAASGGLVAVDQVVVGCFEEHDAIVDALGFQVVERLREFAEEHAAAGVDDDGDPGRPAGSRDQFGHLAEERRREVVHDEEAEVLE